MQLPQQPCFIICRAAAVPGDAGRLAVSIVRLPQRHQDIQKLHVQAMRDQVLSRASPLPRPTVIRTTWQTDEATRNRKLTDDAHKEAEARNQQLRNLLRRHCTFAFGQAGRISETGQKARTLSATPSTSRLGC